MFAVTAGVLTALAVGGLAYWQAVSTRNYNYWRDLFIKDPAEWGARLSTRDKFDLHTRYNRDPKVQRAMHAKGATV